MTRYPSRPVEITRPRRESGHFVLTLGDRQVAVPELIGSDLRRWLLLRARIFTDAAGTLGELADAGSWGEMRALEDELHESGEQMIDLLLLYDRTSAIGTRDWIRSNLTWRQLEIIVRAIAAEYDAG